MWERGRRSSSFGVAQPAQSPAATQGTDASTARNARARGLLTFSIFLLCASYPSPLRADAEPTPWSVSLFAGRGTDNLLQDIIRFRSPEFNRFYLVSAAAARRLAALGPYLSLEGELQTARHLEDDGATELNPLIVLRWSLLPWSKLLPGSFAFGNGVSYASALPRSEDTGETGLSRLLYSILLEFDVGIPGTERFSVIARVHHRSGVFGIFTERSQGSNYLCAGAKVRF